MKNASNLIIKHIHIEGLWNKYVIDFPVNDDVNILVGDNGVGKTTILNILYSILADSFKMPVQSDVNYKEATILLSNDYKVVVRTDTHGTKQKEWFKSNKHIEKEQVPIWTIAVSTFDTAPVPKSLREKLIANYPMAYSELDLALLDTLDSFYLYKSRTANIYRKLAKSVSVEIADQLYDPYETFKQICNQLFDDKEWIENETDGKVQFLLKDTQKYLDICQLSSGEKQLLILLVNTLIQHQASVVTFWDEPEISLHIAWQQQIIRIVRELNPNIQLIIATHSPSILYEGWEQRAINVSDIKHI